MRGAEGSEKRGTESAEGVGSGDRVSPSQFGWGLGRGCASPQEIVVKFTLNLLILQHFMRITTV